MRGRQEWCSIIECCDVWMVSKRPPPVAMINPVLRETQPDVCVVFYTVHVYYIHHICISINLKPNTLAG